MWAVATRSTLNKLPARALLNGVRGKKKRAGGGGNATAVAMAQDAEDVVDFVSMKAEMDKVLNTLERGLSRIRAGGAAPEMLDEVRVDAYGARANLRDVAAVSVRDARTLAVAVHDPSVAPAVERAIRAAGLGLNPVPDGRTGALRVPVPRADATVREKLCRGAQSEAEKARVAARNVRRDNMDKVKKAKIDKNQAKAIEKDVQKTTDSAVQAIERLITDKVRAIKSG